MKKFLKWVSIVVASLLAIFIVGGLLLPSKWSIKETKVINAPAEKLYEQIADLKNWQNWSPWTKASDETAVYTYEGEESGIGAKWLWKSEKMGKGFLEITKAEMSKGIDYTLFIDMNNSPSTILGALHYEAMENGAHNVIWTDEGDAGNNLAKRWMTIVIKYMLGRELEAGLTKLKNLVEEKPVAENNDGAAEGKEVAENEEAAVENKDAVQDKDVAVENTDAAKEGQI